MAKKKRRTRSPHPGVVLIPPDPERRHPTWRARYLDPDTGRTVKKRLEPLTHRTAEARRDWAVRKAKVLARRRDEIAAGAPKATGTSLAKAVERYFEDHPQLRPATIEVYKASITKFTDWCAAQRIASVDDVTGPVLVQFRAGLVRESNSEALKSGPRGARQTTAKPRSANTVNKELRAVGTVLGYLRRLGLLPRLTSDGLSDSLAKLQVSFERLDYLKPAELQALLGAALRHDAATFAQTREEHAGERPMGTTARYSPIAPFVAFLVLTGMRLNEGASLKWSQVDLDAKDNDGKVVGEIHLSSATKTKRARSVGLEVSPALLSLLTALRGEDKQDGPVFTSPITTIRAAERRLKREFDAPATFGWQVLRQACGTYLTNAPGIFGGASAYQSAKQLGHSVAIAERHYVGVARGIPREARTLEAAMGIEQLMAQVINAVSAREGE